MSLGKEKKTPRYPMRLSSLLVLLFFVLVYLVGVASGESGRILSQAVQVCLSCIGLG